MKYFVLSAFMLVGLLSCNKITSNKADNTSNTVSVNKDSSNKARNINRTIYIQPYENFSKTDLKYLETELKKYYKEVIVKEDKKLPKIFYVKERNRFRADSIISYQKKEVSKKGVTVLGVISYDISTTYKGNKDWGVMGLGYLPGSSCVVSTFRLNKKNKREQLVKTAVHEIGHTLGLPHCPNKECFMEDANGKNKWDNKHNFCDSCIKLLRKV